MAIIVTINHERQRAASLRREATALRTAHSIAALTDPRFFSVVSVIGDNGEYRWVSKFQALPESRPKTVAA